MKKEDFYKLRANLKEEFLVMKVISVKGKWFENPMFCKGTTISRGDLILCGGRWTEIHVKSGIQITIPISSLSYVKTVLLKDCPNIIQEFEKIS